MMDSLHSEVILRMVTITSFLRASSEVKAPLDLETFRNCRFNPSMACVHDGGARQPSTHGQKHR